MNRNVLVIGGGISGLAAAYALRDVAKVTVLESSDRVGGKLRSGSLAGFSVDVGAEMVLARRPEAVELARAVGLELVHPATTSAQVLVEGELHPLPGGTLLGVPTEPKALVGLLATADLARIEAEAEGQFPPLTTDVAVGALVRERLGSAIVDRLVDPLLGGVYAGHADRLSLQATVPGLAAELAKDGSLVRSARRAAAAARGGEGPVFATIRGGLGRLPEAVAEASKASLVVNTTARELQRTADGWRVITGPTTAPVAYEADSVVVAVPAPAAARLLAPFVDTSQLGAVELASTALVSFAFPPSALPAASGVLVPASEGRFVKAVTWSSSKWSHLPGDVTLVRASVGRAREVRDLQMTDEELAARAGEDLRALGGPTAEPLDWIVTRWGGGLPQYGVGHLDLVARVRAGLPAGVAVCGAVWDGVGVPSCIRSGQQAAMRISASWEQ
ncbi:MAG: protoporphyrinogen/coproporphyrinogen oxidase [Frankiaceae bacterium]|nr:protoporphyrinogen/coproporphyrinogen oxidase [Frankiaceae bacterium]